MVRKPDTIYPLFDTLPKVNGSFSCLSSRKGVVFSGLYNLSKAFLIDTLQKQLSCPILYVTRGSREEDQAYEDFELIASAPAFQFPNWEVLPSEGIPPHPDISAERMRLLYQLHQNPEAPSIIITGISTLAFKTPSQSMFSKDTQIIEKNRAVSFSDLVRTLFNHGYKRVDRVENVGEYSVRGGIIDLFSPADSNPYRLEFWGDTIDTIRFFSPASQLSLHHAEEVYLLPANEYGYYKRSQLTPLLSYFPPNTLIVLDEPAELEKKLCQLRQFTENAADYFLADSELYAFIEQFAHCSVSTSSQTAEPFFKDPYPVLFGITPPSFLTQLRDGNKKTPELIEHTLKEISYLLHDNYSVTLSFNNEGERERFNEICMDKRIDSLTRCPSVIGSISGGFICPELSYAFLSDQEIFGRTPVRRSRKKFKYSAPLYTVFDIQIGDYVVHAQYGIGRYQGIQHILHDGKQQEMMVIEYANKGVLYVPLIHSNLVRRYIGCGAGETPKLDVLGSNSWMRKRKSVEEAVFDLAAEFLDIQAARKTLSGTQFKPDTPWEREFEAAFIYEETADQLSAIHSVKSDMESTRPMDRLICGDVGYGKTEVAIRAAFKAVMNGKQVAILVPTTILAQQHYKVFSERMADYPVNVEMLSRFRTNAQQRDIIKAANAGSIDILIGTHRLIQHDVRFKDLGLVIIDEEQRFGVRHKEQLKRMRRMVDVLTMTATPIPRTLYLALVGARDMSTINTPPEDRLPVHTYVTSYDDTVIQQAIQREMNREGQVFFVHNRVKSIEKIQNKLQKIVPEARFGIAHGQMHEKELSAIMDLFRAGEIDVLVCTTIIESGLDIPNANTIIIDRADLIGLADLYQLRGRVGRFKHRAYAYMLVPAYKITSEQASKRLDAIETHQDLGAGFQIAMRDLEIRGAGNIIGEQQHGHISAVGFDLYCKLLKNAIAQLKGETIPQPPDVQVKLGFDAIIPSSYIASENQRLAIYSRLQEITNISQIDELHKELDDIYGDPPVPVEVLLDVVRIKLLAAEKRISSVEVKENKLLIKQNEFFLTDSSQKHYRIRHNSELEVTNSIKTILKELSSYDTI